MDLTTKLPDEVLMEIFGHLPSLRDQLGLESVSRRFQRCLIDLLNTKPIPFESVWWNGHLNGYKVCREQLLGAVQSLADKAKFKVVSIDFNTKEELDVILGALVNSKNDCLAKVTTFHIESMKGNVSQPLLQEAIAKCAKLMVFTVDFFVRPVNSETTAALWNMCCPMDLDVVLKDKALTQLSIRIESYTQQQMIQLFHSIKPNTLKSIQLHLRQMTLVDEIDVHAWMAVQEIHINLVRVSLNMPDLFSSLTRLPKLRKCHISTYLIGPDNQLVDALKSLFVNQVEMTVHYKDLQHQLQFDRMRGCHMVALIRQVQVVHPDLEVGFILQPGPRYSLTLTLGKMCFEYDFQGWVPVSCPNCTQCGIFYPVVIYKLVSRASDRSRGVHQDVHLANCQLDRCAIGSVIANLNNRFRAVNWRALSAELNEGQNLATIAFESKVMGVGQFQLTIDCGRCLGNSCLRCVQV